MAIFFSNNAALAYKGGGANQAVAASEVDGKLRIIAFSLNLAAVAAASTATLGISTVADGTTVTGASVNISDTLVLGKIPAGYKILRGVINGVASSTCQLSIGLAGADGSGFYTGTTADSATFLRAAATITLDTEAAFALTNGQNHGFTTTKDNFLTATTSVAVLPATGLINGYLVCSAA